MKRPITLYLDEEAAGCLEWLQTTGTIPRGWLSQKIQQAIVKEYKRQTKEI